VKAENQIRNLQWLAQKHPQHSTDLRKAANIIRAISKKWNKLEEQLIVDCQNNIMGVEGSMTRIYWSAIGKALPEPFGFDLLKWLHPNIQKGNPQKDSVIVVRLGLEEVRKMTVIGTTQLDTDEITGDKNTLFF
jgi:hypothetical protein